MIESPDQPGSPPLFSRAEIQAIEARVAPHIDPLLDELRISPEVAAQLQAIHIPLALLLSNTAARQSRPLIVGINGAQGSGKSTLCCLLQMILQHGCNLNVATLSIDDLYLTRTERERLAERIHPLLATRGVPGTHDIALGLQLLEELASRNHGAQLAMPVFNKAIDDRLPVDRWRTVPTPVDLVLFEGWCVGAVPQGAQTLHDPVNALEADEDPQGDWRRYVNQQLAEGYAELFAKLDLLVMLQIPSMQCVFEWRGLQERKLADQTGVTDNSRIMDDAALRRFIMHYERLTRFMLAEMPARADIVLPINANHQFESLHINNQALRRGMSP